MSEYVKVEVHQQPIELCKLLKIANMVGGGGEAKIVISEGYVYLNGEVEFQKRKKVYADDIVEFNGEIIQVSYSERSVEPNDAPAQAEHTAVQNHKNPAKKSKKNKPKKNQVKEIIPAIEDEKPLKSTKRRPISF